MPNRHAPDKVLIYLFPMVGNNGSRCRRVLRDYWRQLCHEGQVVRMNVRQNTHQRPWRRGRPIHHSHCWTLLHPSIMASGGGGGRQQQDSIPFDVLWANFRRLAQQRGWYTQPPPGTPPSQYDKQGFKSYFHVSHLVYMIYHLPHNNNEFRLALELWDADMHQFRRCLILHKCGNGTRTPRSSMQCCFCWRHLMCGNDLTNTRHEAIHLMLDGAQSQQEYNMIIDAYNRVEPNANLI